MTATTTDPLLPLLTWDGRQARTEGWDIFDCDGSDNGPYQLCKLDDPEAWGERPHPFAEDNNAWVHVAAQAAAGSAYHQAALDFLAKYNPVEADSIRRWVATRI